MGKPSPTETERNEALYNDWKTNHMWGWSMRLAKKYGISKARVSQIVDRARQLDAAPNLDHENI